MGCRGVVYPWPMARRRIPWDEIERLYRDGTLSVRAIADIHGVTHPGILKRADKHGWHRASADTAATGEHAIALPAPPDPAATVRAYVAAITALTAAIEAATGRLSAAMAAADSPLGLAAAADLIDRLTRSAARLRLVERLAADALKPTPPEPEPMSDAERAHRIAVILDAARSRRAAEEGASVTSYQLTGGSPTETGAP